MTTPCWRQVAIRELRSQLNWRKGGPARRILFEVDASQSQWDQRDDYLLLFQWRGWQLYDLRDVKDNIPKCVQTFEVSSETDREPDLGGYHLMQVCLANNIEEKGKVGDEAEAMVTSRLLVVALEVQRVPPQAEATRCRLQIFDALTGEALAKDFYLKELRQQTCLMKSSPNGRWIAIAMSGTSSSAHDGIHLFDIQKFIRCGPSHPPTQPARVMGPGYPLWSTDSIFMKTNGTEIERVRCTSSGELQDLPSLCLPIPAFRNAQVGERFIVLEPHPSIRGLLPVINIPRDDADVINVETDLAVRSFQIPSFAITWKGDEMLVCNTVGDSDKVSVVDMTTRKVRATFKSGVKGGGITRAVVSMTEPRIVIEGHRIYFTTGASYDLIALDFSSE